MANQEFNHPSQSRGTAEISPSASDSDPFPDGTSPSIDKDTERQAILKQVTEATQVHATPDARKMNLHGEGHPAPLSTYPIADPDPAGAKSHETKGVNGSIDQPRPDEVGTHLPEVAERGSTLLMRLGTSLRRLPGVEACFVLTEKAIDYVVSVLRPVREVRSGGVNKTEASLTDRYREVAATIPAITGQAFHPLEYKSPSDSLEASKKLHASIIKAAHDLGEAALREDEREKRADHEHRALEEHEARKAAEAVRAIDNLSGASNGETQSIINKLSGPFAISIEQAISLARDAERREVEQGDLHMHREGHAIEARINSIPVPEKSTSCTLAA